MSNTETYTYSSCKKGDSHSGEILNLVCLEPNCIEKSLICAICYYEDHQMHNIKPLKGIINQSTKYLTNLKPLNIDIKQLK